MTGCPEYSDLIKEYALGDIAELTAEERAALEAHLGECEGCREALASSKSFAEMVRPSVNTEVPQEVLESVHANVMTATRTRRIAVLLRRIALFVPAAAAAAITVVVYSLLSGPVPASSDPQGADTREVTVLERDGQMSSSTSTATQPEPRVLGIDVPQQVGSETEDPAVILSSLQVKFNKASEDGSTSRLEEVLTAAKSASERWQNTEHGIEATHLVSRVHAELAEPYEALRAFLEYADRLGAKREAEALAAGKGGSEAEAEATKVTARCILRESDLHFRCRDLSGAVALCDAVIARYPASRYAYQARKTLGGCYLVMRKPEEAMREFELIAAQNEVEYLAKEACKQIASIHFSNQRTAKGIAALEAMAKRFPDEETIAWANYRTALSYVTHQAYTEAIAKLRLVCKNRGGLYSEAAHNLLSRTQKIVVDTIASDTLDPEL